MAKIGVYDSGLGGLTTLSYLIKYTPYHDYIYFADTANFPIGLKNGTIDIEIAKNIDGLKSQTDVVVVACYTASSILKDEEIIKLRPMLRGLDGKDTLILATPKTLGTIYAPTFFRGHTPCLATYVQENEIVKIIGSEKEKINAQKRLLDYLFVSLRPFVGVKNVVIGCTHYGFCKNDICKVLGDVNFYDGNELVKEHLDALNLSGGDGTVKFMLSEKEKPVYAEILKRLILK